ncbi:MAG TPA: alpha/beta hydrolase [Candidatus Nanopelagicales bacterium]
MTSPAAPVVFIHGMYMNGSSWQPWVERASDRGLTCHAPSWPFHQGEPPELRAHVDPQLGHLTFGAVTRHYKTFIDTMPKRPMLIGHSIGGLVVQKLINDGYGRAGVAISSAPPRGIVSFDPHFFRANFPHANPLAGNKPVIMTPDRFHYTFCNTMTPEASAEAFERYVVPESRNVPRSTLTKQGRIDFHVAHAPLLFIAGDQDHLTPRAMITKNVRAYKDPTSTIVYQQFVGRSHFICNQTGWQEVADHALDWLEQC